MYPCRPPFEKEINKIHKYQLTTLFFLYQAAIIYSKLFFKIKLHKSYIFSKIVQKLNVQNINYIQISMYSAINSIEIRFQSLA